MSSSSNLTSQRKKEHIEICLTNDASFKTKTNGFEKYDFLHCAVTEVDLNAISFETIFLAKKITYPFLISCMTGGTPEAENINARFAEAANSLNIPLGVGSQRQALENKKYHNTYKIIRQKAPAVPILGNIGAAQIVQMKSFDQVKFLADLVEADAVVIHVNPAQELMQKNGEPDFRGLLKSIGQLVKEIDVPVFVKEVGAGISMEAAKRLLSAGVHGIDVAGAGGTSWTGVEIIRNKNNTGSEFWDWGIPTSYCLHTINQLRNVYDFTLIGSGGINNAFDAAKAFALGADVVASARILLQELEKTGIEGVVQLISGWFETIRKILFLTGSHNLRELKKNKLVKMEDFY